MNTPLSPAPSSLTPEQAVAMAKLAETAERYEDMTAYMLQGVKDKPGDEITVEERNLISVGYKNLMSARRTAHRVTKQQIDEPRLLHNGGSDASIAKANEYKDKISEELKALIDKVVVEVVQPFTTGPLKATQAEVLVFFKKMEGDYNRYGAEVTEGGDKTAFTSKAEAAYKEASVMCESTTGNVDDDPLPATNPIRLGLALNYSVFMYEIQEKKEEATAMAKEAFDLAIQKLDQLSEEQYRDSTLIMQLLKDNRELWENDTLEYQLEPEQ
jgi:hypothetical protein